jgi:hypothetical protein
MRSAFLPVLVAMFGVWSATASGVCPPIIQSDTSGSVQQSDSQSTRERLRQAQEDFERLRRRHLPRTLGYGGGPCDERIGRLCYWDDDDPDWQPQPEVERVALARDTLLALLDSAAERYPGDGWILGQRVRYLTEVERLDEATVAVERCRADAWWCGALSAFLAHLRQDFAAADAQFAASLAAMPDTLRCEWTDLSEILDGELASTYRGASCGDRESQNERIFWLADPLYLVPGNERRTEHFARLVYDRLRDGTEIVSDLRWGEDNRELVLRYGWSEGWEQTRADPVSGKPSIIGRRRRGGEHFMPPPDFVTSPAEIGWDSWSLDPERPRERYAARAIATFDTLGAQIAIFRRQDAVVVVAALAVPERQPDSAGAAPLAEVALAAMRDEGSGVLITRDTVASREARLSLRLPPMPVFLSVEALNRPDNIAARRRYWLEIPQDPPERFGVSDLLILDRVDQLPSTLDQAIQLARTGTSFTQGDSINIFWELYGTAATEGRVVSLVVTKEDKGFLRRTAEWLGLASSDRPTIRLEWTDTAADHLRGYGRAVTLQLPEGQEGRFTIRLVATTPDGQSAVATKEIRIVERE